MDVTYRGESLRPIVVFLTVSEELLEDLPAMRADLDEWMRRAELASRGFLGSVRCDRCRRRIRCVFVVDYVRLHGLHFRTSRGDVGFFGESCYRIAVG